MYTLYSKLTWVTLAGAAAVATPAAASAVSADIHLDLSNVLVALLTGIFGTIQLYMISKLHMMVNSQQSTLNQIARADALSAAGAAGLIKGIEVERARVEAKGNAKGETSP